MATKNPRLNVVLNPALFKLLKMLAMKETKTMSATAKELIEFAIERHEDFHLSEIAMGREKTNTNNSLVSHEDAWK